MRGVPDITAIAGAHSLASGCYTTRELAGWITVPRRAGARGVRAHRGKPNLSVIGLAAHYDEVISGYMASEPEVLVTDV